MRANLLAKPLAVAVCAAIAAPAIAAEQIKESELNEAALEEVMVVGKSVSYANNAASPEMLQQQSKLTSVMAVIDNLPGVLINEGDTFGADDWSTTVSIRGFQLSLDEQQIGTTIDGIANGNSNYGGGAKANRYIDTENLKGAEVSQGTADIASRSHEALGGTLNFTTINPAEEEGFVASFSTGDFDAQKYYVRYETGEIFPETFAWFSASSSENSDWVNGSAENTRDHLALKFISTVEGVELTGYLSYDDTHEDNYQRVSLAQFQSDPEWDRLNGEWTGVPHIDQVYRPGWSTLRENLLGYLKADFDIAEVNVATNAYFHHNSGRGDWLPPYIVGEGGSLVRFVDAQGNALSPNPGCVSSITFPYGGSGPEGDPACYGAGAIPVGSYRHTHYEKDRYGINADFTWEGEVAGLDNELRGGFWYEDYERQESRDWHQIIDSRSSFAFDRVPYFVQYEREYPVDTLMYYLEDTIRVDEFTFRLGVKQFDVELERVDKFTGETTTINSDSDALFSTGVVFQTPVEGLEVFAGYAENFAAIKDEILEREASALENIEPETAENIDLGLRYEDSRLSASLTYYTIEFENRLTFFSPDSPAGIDFLIGTNGTYRNVGGIDSSGIELSATYMLNDNWKIYGSFTSNESEYVGTGSDAADDEAEIVPGNTVFGSVEDMGVLSLDWSKGNYSAGLSTKWVDERWMDSDNSVRIPAYTVSDFYAAVSIPMDGDIQNLDLRFTVNNVTDEDYLAGVAGESAWIGAPRTAAFNISAQF